MILIKNKKRVIFASYSNFKDILFDFIYDIVILLDLLYMIISHLITTIFLYIFVFLKKQYLVQILMPKNGHIMNVNRTVCE